MSHAVDDLSVADRVDERPSLHPKKLRDLRARELVIRFAIGAIASVLSGLVGLVFGMRAGGIFLASPAILAASLTLIQKQEDSAEAREDARGAIAGGIAMAAFALVAALALGHMSWVVALLISTVTWLASALGLYVLVWFR